MGGGGSIEGINSKSQANLPAQSLTMRQVFGEPLLELEVGWLDLKSWIEKRRESSNKKNIDPSSSLSGISEKICSGPPGPG